jgi:hypothetical protein
MLLRGTMSKPRTINHDAALDEAHEKGSSLMDAPPSCATCHWLIAEVTSISLNRSVEEPKSNPTAEHSRRNPLTKPTSHVALSSSGKHNMRMKNRMQLRNHWPCKESWSNSCKREDVHVLGDNLRKLRKYSQCFGAILFRSALVRG